MIGMNEMRNLSSPKQKYWNILFQVLLPLLSGVIIYAFWRGIKILNFMRNNGSLKIGLKPSLPAFIIYHGLKAVAIDNQ
jgi:hypothetical protein